MTSCAGVVAVLAAVGAGAAANDPTASTSAAAGTLPSSVPSSAPALVVADTPSRLEEPRRLASALRREGARRAHRGRLARAARTARAAERARLESLDPRDLARSMAARQGWGVTQFRCLDSLWTKESGWDRTASNPSSGAYGIPQALPGQKMASAGSDWRTNPVTQIRWGLQYIAATYGSPCAAWGHSGSHGWY